MRRSYLFHILAFVAFAIVSFTSCKKENGIDNDTVIKKPYSLYIGDDMGSLLNTNNGDLYKTIFMPDGFGTRAIVTSGQNILFVKKNVHMSADNGLNFNPTDQTVNSFYLALDNTLGRQNIQWPSIIWNAASHGRIYLATIQGKGVLYSEDTGKTWITDMEWDHDINNDRITSFTQLANGLLFGYNINNDSLYRRDDRTDKWSWVNQNNKLPDGPFYLTSFNNALIATDMSGAEGAWHSNDSGRNWVKYNGLPSGILLATAAPFGQTLLVGTNGKGIYRLQNGQFVASNLGLDDNTSVFAIVGKDDIYKNDITSKYVYIATDKGLYRSSDLGQNWTMVKPGSYISLY